MTYSVTAADGSKQDLSALLDPNKSDHIFRLAHEANLTPAQFLNCAVATGVDQPTVFEQLADSMGYHTGRDSRFGIRPGSIDSILNPKQDQAGAITRDTDLGPRVFFPIYALNVIEKALQSDRGPILGAYNRMVAIRDTLPTDTFERPIIDYTEAEKPRNSHVAQLGEPQTMVKATVSNKIYRIPSDSIGVEYSDQAAKALGLDFLMRGFERRANQQAIDRVYGYINSFINGDVDLGTSALTATKASSFDSTISSNMKLTQKAWVKWLYRNSAKRTIDFVITDLDGALAIQNREGRPTVQTDNANSKRIDTLENVTNPMWPDQVGIFIVDTSLLPSGISWTSGNILGLDSRYGIHHVASTVLNYQGAQEYAIRRSTKLRFDIGEFAYRMYDEAFDLLSLTA